MCAYFAVKAHTYQGSGRLLGGEALDEIKENGVVYQNELQSGTSLTVVGERSQHALVHGCIYVYVCVYVYVHIYVCIYIYMHVCAMRMYVRTYACMYVSYVCMCVTSVCMYA